VDRFPGRADPTPARTVQAVISLRVGGETRRLTIDTLP
jgi:hypothetical protein